MAWARRALLVGWAAMAMIFAWRGRGLDLRVYLTAGARFRAAEPLYRLSDGALPFKYAPPAAWLFTPWSVLPPRLVMAVLGLASVGALAWLLAKVDQRLVPAATPRMRRDWAGVIAMLALAQPTYWVLFYGQVDLLLAALVLAALLLAEDRRATWAALAGALAIILKPPTLLVVLVWVAQRRWRVVAASLPISLGLWLPVLARYGWSGTVEQIGAWTSLLGATTRPWVSGYNSQGLPTLLLDLLPPQPAGPSPLALLVAQVAAVTLAGAFVLATRPRLRWLVAWTVLLVAYLSPLAWRANLVAALPLLLLSLAAEPAMLRRGAWVLAAALTVAGVVVTHEVLGELGERAALYGRPFAWLLLLLLAWSGVFCRQRDQIAAAR